MSCEIKTNDKTYKLTNLDISTHYRDREYWFMRSDFMGAFAYWAVSQSPYDSPDIDNALKAFSSHVNEFIDDDTLKKFSYDDVFLLVNEDIFERIPEIEILNHRKNGREGMGFCSRYDKPSPDDDFIDLNALARNICYMVLRESITQS